MSDDPRGYGVKLQTKIEKSVPSCNQPDCRTVDSPAGNIEKSNKTAAMGPHPYSDGSNAANVGKGTTNPAQGKTTGLRTLPQGFTAGSGNPPSRLGD
jgi:hypothetical protein